MKATVLRVVVAKNKDIVAPVQKSINDFLSTPIEGNLPQVRFICQSEFCPETDHMAATNPHVMVTILWE